MPAPEPMPVRKVHLVFKTHLDVGFTDTAAAVVRRYFESYIPQALDLAAQLRESGGPERFVWTTGSWLLHEYLERAAPAERARMEASIEAGDIAWHALPFTTYSEFMDASLFRHGLSLSQRLDARFGKQTIAAKMTDVPGHTRAIVPLLAAAGVRFLHIGVNAASCPPDVPAACRWRDPSGAEIVLMYHKASYGEGLALPGMGEALQFAFTGDNLGPQNPEAIREVYAEARLAYPEAEIAASTLDAYARAVLAVKDTLPVLEAEIGDTWIHGAGSDPAKAAGFRALSRLRREWLASGNVKASDPPVFALSQNLLLAAEHTWGMDIKTHLDDFETYETEAFRAAREQPNFQKVESSWAEQRAYIEAAVEAVSETSLGIEARAALRQLEPREPDRRGLLQLYDHEEPLDTAHFQVAFGPDGALIGLRDQVSGLQLADPKTDTEAGLGAFRYQTFSDEDYERYYQVYNQNKEQTAFWARPDFTKPGMATAGAESRTWAPTLQGLWHRANDQGDTFLAELSGPAEAARSYGCPRRLTLEFAFPRDEKALYLTLQWFQKGACRLPEALWLSFGFRLTRPEAWKLEKLGQFVSPLAVVRGGNRRLHAVDRGCFYDDGFSRLSLESLDAPLVAPGAPGLLDFSQRQPDLGGGLHFNLFNNIWGTNHPMWYDDNAKFRFVLRFA